jgi:hypothetical protein
VLSVQQVQGLTYQIQLSAAMRHQLQARVEDRIVLLWTGYTPASAAAAAAGPKFFGFTDVNMRLAIAVQYTAAELAYVQHGVSLPAAGAQQPTQQQQQQQEQQDVQQQMHKHQQQQQEQAQQPLRPVLQQLSPAELLARELECSTRGVGAATAAVLATTKSLGGVQHGSLAGLKQWLAADDRHREQLQAFLLHRCADCSIVC